MAESDKTERLFFDTPTKLLFGLTGGMALIVVGLAARAWLRHPADRAPVARVLGTSGAGRRTTAPTPTPENALVLFTEEKLAFPGWHATTTTPEAYQATAPSGALFQQRLLPESEGLSPRAIAERLDSRLARWGQEYQQIHLDSVIHGGLKMTRLEYALNLPGKPTQRTRTIFGRVRVQGERRVASWTLAATEEHFEQELATLEQAGIRL